MNALDAPRDPLDALRQYADDKHGPSVQMMRNWAAAWEKERATRDLIVIDNPAADALAAIRAEVEGVEGEMRDAVAFDPGPPGPRWKPLAYSTVTEWADRLRRARGS